MRQPAQQPLLRFVFGKDEGRKAVAGLAQESVKLGHRLQRKIRLAQL
jgi:hypothetical protein